MTPQAVKLETSTLVDGLTRNKSSPENRGGKDISESVLFYYSIHVPKHSKDADAILQPNHIFTVGYSQLVSRWQHCTEVHIINNLFVDVPRRNFCMECEKFSL